MAVADISNRMEVLIPEDVLKDMMEPGKLFKRLLDPQKPGEEISQRPHASVTLEKMAEGVIKLLISVGTSVNSQENTESGPKSDVQQNEVSNSAQQTDNTETASRLMQTDKKCEQSQQQQTEKNESQDSAFQTTTVQYREMSVQTTNKKYVEYATQTDIKEFCNSQSQTVIKKFHEVPCQTVIKEFSDTPCQTVIREFSTSPCQTDFSLANLTESECQATTLMCSGESQTELEVTDHEVQATVNNMDNVSQTEILCSDGSVQTVKDEGMQQCQTELSMLCMLNNTSQTEIDMTSRDAQTESSFAFMEEFGCQMAPDMTELCVQTETAEVRAVPCQTEIATLYAETQTTPDLSNRETQTDALEAVTISDMNTVSNVDMNMPPHLDQHIPVEGDFILPTADIQSITPLAVVAMEQVEKSEACIQTDPVTIIIGDASFLVERLKGTVVKTEKKEREIEVEFAENGTAEVKRKRSGYIPGSGLANPFLSPPLPGRIPIDKLKPTQVKPFNPRLLENIQLLRGDDVSPRKLIVSPVRRTEKKVAQREPVLQQIEDSELIRGYRCPFCVATFQQSTNLYHHITGMHSEKEQKTTPKSTDREPNSAVTPSRTISKPKFVPSDIRFMEDMPEHVRASVERYRDMALAAGQQPPGYPRNRIPGAIRKPRVSKSPAASTQSPSRSKPVYRSPPVLHPVYNQVQLVGDDGQDFSPSPSGKTYKRQAPTIQAEPNLFEDLPEPKRAFPRGRVRRSDVDDESVATFEQQADAYEYECPHCPERYGSASHLYGHLKRSHKHELEQERTQESPSDSGTEHDKSTDLNKSPDESSEPLVSPACETEHDVNEDEYENQEEAEQHEEPDVNDSSEDLGDEEQADAEEEEGDVEHEETEQQPEIEGETEATEEQIEPPMPGKRKRKSSGRPPKKKKMTENHEQDKEEVSVSNAPKKGRPGRPPKDSRPRKSGDKVQSEPKPVKKLTRTRKPRVS